MNSKDMIVQFIENNRDEFIQTADEIWDAAELGLKEYQSAAILIDVLKKYGFEVQENLAGLPTAFMGSWGSGKPIIAVLGEFDALPELSQQAGSNQKTPIVEGGAGHGCMHNLLGTASLAAAIAISTYMEENHLAGTVRYYGCPGEEHGCGKVFMTRAGVFDGIDAALCWHPDDSTAIWSTGNSALIKVDFEFKGKAAHAARCPHLGRSALDAAELMSVGSNYLREHMSPNTKLHYGYKNAGNPAPNIVQDYACVTYVARGPKITDVNDVLERIIKIANGAAMMTETEVSYSYKDGTSEYRPNMTLTHVLYEAMQEVGAPQFDRTDYETAKMFREGIPQEMIAVRDTFQTGVHIDEAPTYFLETPLNTRLCPLIEQTAFVIPSSTDVGSVSYVVPMAQVVTACKALGTPNHSWMTTTQGKSGIAHKGMLTAAKIMALGAVKMLEKNAETKGELFAVAKDELMKKTGGKFVAPFPDSVMPDFE